MSENTLWYPGDVITSEKLNDMNTRINNNKNSINELGAPLDDIKKLIGTDQKYKDDQWKTVEYDKNIKQRLARLEQFCNIGPTEDNKFNDIGTNIALSLTDVAENFDGNHGTQLPTVSSVMTYINSIDYFEKIKKKIFDNIYPVNAIFITLDQNFKPNTVFGGQWDLICNDGRVLMGINTNTTTGTGGQKEQTITLPDHKHTTEIKLSNIGIADSNKVVVTGKTKGYVRKKDVDSNTKFSLTSKNQTLDQDKTWNITVNVLQPYQTCYIWKRTSLVDAPQT